jgi:outer membrane protein TolC
MHRNVLLAEQQAELARVRLELAQEEYSVGAIDYTSLQQIVESNDQAQRSAIEARFAYLNARVALEERIGTPLDAGN